MKPNQYETFKQLHYSSKPLILYNIWNIDTAKILEKIGGQSIATSSYAIAESLGHADGEKMPWTSFLAVIESISENITKPLSVDIESGYNSNNNENLMDNIEDLLNIGVSGINIEDQIIGCSTYTLVEIAEQCRKIKQIKNKALSLGTNIFINARTDVFLKERNHTINTVEQALERCFAYQDAGAEAIFVPGLLRLDLIEKLVSKSALPVNIMVNPHSPNNKLLQAVGVKRISYGPTPYFIANALFEKEARKHLEQEGKHGK